MGLAQDKSQFNHIELVKFRDAFDKIDQDNDGRLSQAELKNLFAQVGSPISDQEFTAVMREAVADSECDLNSLDFLSFLNALAILKDAKKNK